MERILIVGHHRERCTHLRERFQNHFPHYQVQTVRPQRTALKSCPFQETALTLFDFTTSGLPSAQALATLRDKGFQKSIIFISEDSTAQDLSFLQRDTQAVAYRESLNSHQGLHGLFQLSQLALKGQPLAQRLFKRFATDQVIGLEAFGRSGQVAARLLKVSRGGALLKLIGDTRLRSQELLQLHIQLFQIGRFHTVPAQITAHSADTAGEERAWIQPGDHFGVRWLTDIALQSLRPSSTLRRAG